MESPQLENGLRARGAQVDALVAYENAIGTGGINLKHLLNAGFIDAITFPSATTVHNLVERLSQEGGAAEMLQGIPAACIGRRTAAAAEGYGMHVIALPESHTLEGMVSALEAYFVRVTRSDL
jgi:uroporphyrinogen-III synthase